jgi:hypothetical protein
VRLRDLEYTVPEAEYLGLEYMDWKSGGDTNFAPIATADGRLDCRGFWNAGDERPDKGATFTANAPKCPTITRYVESVGADFGRVRTISSNRRTTTLRSATSTATTTTASTPTIGVGCTWLETPTPDSYMP